MKCLTKGCMQYPHRAVAEPALLDYNFRDRRYLWDPNAMVLATHEGEVPKGWSVPWKPTFPYMNAPQCGALVLEVTDACNLACEYCFVTEDAARSRSKKTMTFETAVSAISNFFLSGKLQNRQARPVVVGFFGGEPLLAGPLIRKVVEFNERTFGAANCRFSVTTNATLLDEDWARYFSKHNFSLIVSIDGPQEAHDASRLTKQGAGSYDGVINALNLLRIHAPRAIASTTLRATFTPSSTCSVTKRLDHLNLLCDRGLGNHVSVEPAFLGERVCFDKSKAKELTPNMEQQERWLDEMHEAADWFLARIRAQEKPPRYHHIGCHVKRLLVGHPQPSECGAGKGYFSIGADGTIYACHRETSTKIGHMEAGGIDHELAAPWQDNRYYARQGCASCSLRNICGGGCREVSVVEHGDLTLPVASECAFKELWFKEAGHIIAETMHLDGITSTMPFLRHSVGIRPKGAKNCGTR